MEIFEYQFFTNALIAVTILSAATAAIGTYVVTRRMVFIAGGITHASFGGLGLGYYLGIPPAVGAAAFAIGGSLGAGWLSRRMRSDSAIAVMWAVGMALGILFIFMSEGYVPELNTFLFGNVLTVSRSDLWIFGGFTAAALAFMLTFRRLVVTVSFDKAFARTRNLPARSVSLIMTVVVAVAIVLSIRLIGIMLLMSLLSLPQITAERLTRRYGPLMLLSGVFSLAGCLGGLFLAWVADVPASAFIVLILALLYAGVYLLTMRRIR